MAFKTVTYKVIGMHQDLSESAASDKYSYENMNIRIDSRNNNTMLSIENERGNAQITSINVWKNLYRNSGEDYDILLSTINSLPFIVIGECLIDKYIVLFGKYQNNKDIIARLEYIPTGDRSGWNMVYFYNSNQLNFSLEHPIQTVANIETEKTKKVYWVDGLNEPRIINIVSESYINNADIYNLTASLNLNENFWVTKSLEDGYFPQGKIQYCYTYFNDTDTETNIIDYSPLFDITYKDNGVSQAATNVTTQAIFTIHIDDLDTSFKYLKIYRIITTSPGVTIVTSAPKIPVPTNGGSIDYVDNYRDVIEDSLTFAEDSISSKQSFVPQTLATKDNTLFFGNIKLKKPSVENINFYYGQISSFLKTIGIEEFSSNKVYQYKPSLTTFKGSNHSYKGFKKYNWYKLGFIAQYKTGEWSNVIPLGTVQCDISSETVQSGNDVLIKIPNFKYSFSVDDITTLISLYNNGFKKIKPVCVLPNPQERTVIAQGILSPTVYRGEYRNSVDPTLPFAQPSWFFRPKLLVSPVTKTNDRTYTTYKIDYAYTLRNQDDMIDLTRPNINASNWHKGNITSTVNFNPLFREYRHAFALPPKDRINAELDSSDAISNAYFVGTSKGSLEIHPMLLKTSGGLSATLTSADAFFVGRLIDPETNYITDATAEKVLLPNKKYYPTGYLHTYYVDESIFTFNSPEIDYADIIGGSAPIDLQSSSLYLNVAAAAQITSSYNNIDIAPNSAPANDPAKSKYFNDGVGSGRCLFNLSESANTYLKSIFNQTKYTCGFNGYKPLMAGPWWYEWIYALGYVDKADGSDPQCENNPFEINQALAIQADTSGEHYVFRTATGSASSEFKQSWYGQLDKSSTSRLTLIYSENKNVMLRDYLAYTAPPLSGDTKNYYPPIAIHNFINTSEGGSEQYPNEGDFSDPYPWSNKSRAAIAWLGYGLTAAIKNKSTNWLYQYFFPSNNTTDFYIAPYTYYNIYDNSDRGALYRPNAYDSFMAKGYWPCGALIPGGSDVNITVKSKYGCHIYSNSETKFPHTAFERYYPHIIYPFMSSTTPLNGNTSLYKSDGEPSIPIPKVKKHTTLLYSKNTIFYNSFGLGNTSLSSNINSSILSNKTGLELLDFDWTNNIYNSNEAVTYQGIFKNSQPIFYQTEHLIASLKWYRGFNTLGSTPLGGIEGIAKYLDLETFNNDILFAGWFKPIYKKSGYLQNIILHWGGYVNGLQYSTDSRYNDFNYLYDTPVLSSLNIDYYSTPHIVSSYKLESSNTRILPEIQLDSDDNLEMDYNNINNKLVLEYYAKEYLKHTAFVKDQEDYGFTNPFEIIPKAIRNSIYPHTGCWAKVIPDEVVTIQSDSSNNTYPFWLHSKADNLHYGIVRDTLSIPTNKIMGELRGIRTEPQKAFLHIGEYLNVNNYKTSPYTSINVDALDWVPCGISYKLSELIEILQNGRDAYIEFKEGDIYFQRYNCLKTCGNSAESEDFNAIIEHASVFVESYINLDGRYDQNRFISHLDSIQNFDSTVYTGSLNPIYSKKDNYFSYKQLDYTLASAGIQHFPTAILWSLEKLYGENIDSWSVVPMNNVYYADGVCGEITDLQTIDNKLYCFQYSGISVVDFNPRALIQTDTNSPISISANNAVKMQGLVYISKDLGTYNKWTNVKTKGGMYFVDNNLKNIFRLESSGGIKNISVLGGMMLWSHNNLSDRVSWSPASFYSGINNAFTGYYDTVFDDVYFVNKDVCLVYNEKLEAFTSFYSYASVPFMFNYRDKFFSVYYDTTGVSSTTLWEQFAGDYQKIYGTINLVNYIDILVNDNLLYDKVFNFMEFYYNCFEQDTNRPGNPYTKLTVDTLGFPVHQISTLEASNEYQYGLLTPSMFNIKPKYRVWRAEIPRDSINKLDRIRSQWVRLKLTLHNSKKLRQLIHTISVNYTIPIQPIKEN